MMEIEAGTEANAPVVLDQISNMVVNNTIAVRPGLWRTCSCLPHHQHT
jgi:hypothetical protein